MLVQGGVKLLSSSFQATGKSTVQAAARLVCHEEKSKEGRGADHEQ